MDAKSARPNVFRRIYYRSITNKAGYWVADAGGMVAGETR